MLNPKLENKIIFDYVMLLLFLTLQLKNITSVKMHEFLGVALVVLVICHCIFNRDWLKSIVKVKKNARFVINIILFISFLTVIISGIMLSVVVFRPLGIIYNEHWFLIHTWSAKITLAMVVVHLFNHAKMIRTAFRKKKNKAVGS